jgi:hypothetical protein
MIKSLQGKQQGDMLSQVLILLEIYHKSKSIDVEGEFFCTNNKLVLLEIYGKSNSLRWVRTRF